MAPALEIVTMVMTIINTVMALVEMIKTWGLFLPMSVQSWLFLTLHPDTTRPRLIAKILRRKVVSF